MHAAEHGTYPPLNTLKRVCDDVWIVDGPMIRFGMPWPKLSFPTRMTVLRTRGDDHFIHSSTPLVPARRGAGSRRADAAVETMISWDPARIILAHGRWYPSNGADELRRAFRWILD